MHEKRYAQEDRSALHKAVGNAYVQLDDATRNYWGSPHPYGPKPLVNSISFTSFLEHFGSEERSRGYMFTLNQDLFVERWYVPREKLLTMPGIKPLSWNPRERPLTRDDYISVPSTLAETQGSISNHLYYIKLHGSMNWLSSDG
jgi:hypothetical protein